MCTELKQLTPEELDYLAESIEHDPESIAHLLFPECPPGHRAVIKQIGLWAANRKLVLENTANGNLHIATVFDKVCYRCWQRLPGYAKNARIPGKIDK